MAVIPESIRPLRGETSSETATTARGRRTRANEQEWTLLTDDPDDGPDSVKLDLNVVRVGDIYRRGNDYDPGCWCQSVEVTADRNHDNRFYVRAKYANKRPEEEDNPLLRGAVWSSYFRREELFIPYDRLGNPYTNSADVPFEDPPPTRITIMGRRITVNVAAYNDWDLAQWHDAVNTTTWNGAPASYAQVASVTPGEWQTENEVTYCPLTYAIEVNPLGWQPVRILNQGRRVRNAAGKLVQPDDEGVHHDQIVMLAADGTQQPDGAAPINAEFYPFPTKPFTWLPF